MMQRTFITLLVASSCAVCCAQEVAYQMLLRQPERTAQEFAADEVDKIYWQQNFGDKESLLSSLADPAAVEYARINYGPWDRIDGKPFVDGYLA